MAGARGEEAGDELAGMRAEGAGVELAYDERGMGPAALLVHGTALTRLAWRETIDALGNGVRAIAYDRRGYGDSGAPEPYTGTTIEEQAEDAAALLRRLEAAPAVVCGHATGAVVALDLLLRHAELLRGAVLIEPPLYALSATAGEALGELREVVEEAARERGAVGAVEAFVAASEGEAFLAELGSERADAVRASVRGVFADLGAVTAWEFSRRALRGIEHPATILRGARSAALWREIAASLAELLPGAELRELDTGHMAPLDAPDAVAAAIRALASP